MTQYNLKRGEPDKAWTVGVLEEIRAVLAKHKALLVHKPDCIVLARGDRGLVWQSLAQIEYVAPDRYRWRPVEVKPTPGRIV